MSETKQPASELKPCPFCGSTSLEIDNLGDGDDWYVSCSDCDIQQIANYTTRDVAIQRWNTRFSAALTAARNALEHIPVQYKGRSSFDYNERLCVFEVSANGYVITSAEDSEVARAICELFNLLAGGTETA